MTKNAGKPTNLGDPPEPPSFVVADSTFDLDVKDVKNWKEKPYIFTGKISLIELSDAAW